jgi:cytochrome c-type biogenesis protein CcmF
VKSQLGSLAVAAGFAASVVGIAVLGVGLRRRDTRLLRLGGRFVPIVLVAALAAAGVMEWALVTHDFSLRYVAENGSRTTPLLYTVAGLWAALEGSILLWGLILSVHLTLLWAKHRRRIDDPLVGWAMLVGLAVAVFFFGLMLGPANPFHSLHGAVPADGRGPNPLLQNHPLMAVHPPMLYLGYVGFTVPFAFAIAALVTGRVGEGWLAETRRTTLLAWGFLTAGIVLGAWWSYEVLGWGGYFAWDPVENASLLPWLTATAFLHSLMVQERRGMLRVWNLSLLVATFSLTILGTFLTRSGVVASVHAFTRSSIGPALLGFLAVVSVVGVGLIAWRADRLASPSQISSPVSRDAAFLANNVVFGGLAFVVLLGTTFPLLAEAITGDQLSVGEPYFERMSAPLGIALLFLMAVAPNLPWRAAGRDVLRRRLARPAWFAAGTMLVLALAGATGIAQLAAFGLAAFALAAVVTQITTAVRARRHASVPRMGVVRAAVRTFTGNRRLYGGLVVHVGVVLVAVALAASQGYSTKREVSLARGESATVRGYRVTYLGTTARRTPQKTRIAATIDVHRGGARVATLRPALSIFPGATSAIGTPSVHTSPVRDVYLTLVSSPNEAGRITVGVFVNPMVMWLWLGGAVMVGGAVFAAWPDRRRARTRGPAAVGTPPAPAAPDRVLEGAPA